jgi:hypothetical protein
MTNSLLLGLLTTFTKKEWRELDRFIRSPFFNTRTEVISFFEGLTEGWWWTGIEPDKQKLFKRVYGKEPFSDQKVRLLMSDLLRLAEQYLVCRDLTDDEVKSKTTLSKIYRLRGLPKHFRRSLKQANQEQNKSPRRNADYYRDAYEIQLEQYRYDASIKRTTKLNLQLITNYMDVHHLVQKLRMVCTLLSHQAVYKADYDFGMLEEILSYVEQNELLEVPAIAVYYYCYRSLTEPDQPEYFQEFKRLILEKGAFFTALEMRDLTILAINFCIRNYNKGNHAYLKEEFDIYREGLEKGYLIQDGSISRFTYRNVVTLGLVMEEYDWVESFIYEYRDLLPTQYRESMFSFCLARLSYSRKQYDESLSLLQKAESGDLLLQLASRAVRMKIYYELQELDVLDSHLEAMKVFIRRKKVMGYHQTNYLNMIHFMKKMLELNIYDRREVVLLKEELQQTKSVAEKNWLLKQLQDL